MTISSTSLSMSSIIEPSSLIRRLAVSQDTLENYPTCLEQLFTRGLQAWCWDLFIIVDMPENLHQILSDPIYSNPGPKWEVQVRKDMPRASWSYADGWKIIEDSSRQDAHEGANKLLRRITDYDFPVEEFKLWFREAMVREFQIQFANEDGDLKQDSVEISGFTGKSIYIRSGYVI
ncbi:uncharacterized protein BO97DRAFT_418371 [Aspergillus homomorphus CBS 101889]|uniref:Uncharacterized protein n=1 Tax=Aspergillus homomorphus (strain CBS 101889) TaxID=1450537 RepID=A0A395HKG9_ASPHC|nr:hypothetical protein BO97DRAFT_418371 [Aspergillus homomorphus CBS 101889]RAL07705.1 hypothetical protein BO97DRAFT_418371 [Aspergillus homomorphus CBS 101889]